MKTALGLTLTLSGIFVAFLLQEALPHVHAIHGARFIFVTMIFCYAAMVLPFPAMVFAALYTGLLSDLMYLNIVSGRVEIALGWSIVFFVIVGCIAQGLQPGLHRGHWWPLIPLSAVATSGYLLLQFGMISLRREGFVFEEAVAWRILAPGALAALFSPLLYLAIEWMNRFLPSEPKRVRGY